ncbi:TrkA-C domain protein [Desulfurispirillum indicum S5]|uniref:TrkA-C domain protein n=1 Tax=Desulfurispirillum indicum (strain ATCC BAA-1389 / DSM 22839 / S5) TaxID=653733 RepID=E6W287_DESIS|nr:NAD-binding protein [Desulfurispirillum indicum]ADU65545.1 TrkA-C domain protein [Desulfurispirillum indicum S5]
MIRMLETDRRVVLCGLGYFEQRLLAELDQGWNPIVIDLDQRKTGLLANNFPGTEFITGDASSIVTWKKLPLASIDSIIVAVKESDISLEICRLVREFFHLEVPLMVLIYEDSDEDAYLPFNVVPIKPFSVSINIILNKLQRNYSKAIDIGLKRGEIIELSVLAKSHLTDRKIRTLRPSKWFIAALYRNNEIVLPVGEEVVQVGDRVVLFGEPKILESLANTFLQGTPQFPVQYGNAIAAPLDRNFPTTVDEVVYLFRHLKANRLNFYPLRDRLSSELTEKVRQNRDISFSIEPSIPHIMQIVGSGEQTGLFSIPGNQSWFFWSFTGKEIFRMARKPFFISRGTHPFTSIYISLNCNEPVYALEVGMELSQMLQIPLRVLFVALPRELRGREEVEEVQQRQELVSDFGNIYKTKIDYRVLEGNPVLQTLAALKDARSGLLITAHDSTSPLSFFRPNVPFLLTRKTHLSTLVVVHGDRV